MTRLGFLGRFFLLGLTAFGGPAAHVALMHRYFVESKLISDDQFNSDMALTHLIPGPNSTELVMKLGYRFLGYVGLIGAGTLFILPAALLTTLISWMYVTYSVLPDVNTALNGVKATIVALIIVAIYKLSRPLFTGFNWVQWVVVVSASVATFFSVNDIGVIIMSGVLYASLVRFRYHLFDLVLLFYGFLKIGSILVGSGYVLVAYLDRFIVDGLNLITRYQLLDAIAIGQMTPGPVLTSATAVGFMVNGFWGAFVSTIGIFLPSFLFVSILVVFEEKLISMSWLPDFLKGSVFGVIVLMVVVCFQLSKTILTHWLFGFIMVVSLVIFLRYPKLNPLLIIALGAWITWLI